MFDWLFKRKWLMVKVFERKDWCGKRRFYYLYESDDGKRKYKIKGSMGFDNSTKEFFLAEVYPWLKGMIHKDVPSYWDVVRMRQANDIKTMYKRFFDG